MWLGVATGYRAHQASDARARRLRSQPQRRVSIWHLPIDSRERLLEEEHPHVLGSGKKGGACLEIVSDPSISRGETR
jgi:hypothetical protein